MNYFCVNSILRTRVDLILQMTINKYRVELIPRDSVETGIQS